MTDQERSKTKLYNLYSEEIFKESLNDRREGVAIEEDSKSTSKIFEISRILYINIVL